MCTYALEAITLIINADIVTMDPNKPNASALAFSDRNPLKVPQDEIRKIKVVTTLPVGLIAFTEIPEYDHDDPPVK